MARPEGETRKERRLQRIIGTGVVVLFLLLGVIVIQGVVQYRSQTNHHASSQAQQAEILDLLHTVRDAQVTNKGTIAEIAALQKQVASVIAGLPAADADLTAFAKQILAVEQFAVTCLTTQKLFQPTDHYNHLTIGGTMGALSAVAVAFWLVLFGGTEAAWWTAQPKVIGIVAVIAAVVVLVDTFWHHVWAGRA